MPKYCNNNEVSLSVAGWLAHDTYDHNPDPDTISVTSLIKPVKEIVLAKRIAADLAEEVKAGGLGDPIPDDVINMVASSMGTAFHDSIEAAWLSPNLKETLIALGQPKSVVNRITVNPPIDEPLPPRAIPVYMELRRSRKVGNYTISGKFDFLMGGRLEDFKSTSTFTYVNKTNDDKFKLQGSIYRWLNEDIVTCDHMAIQYIFTDWSKQRTSDPAYPQQRVLEYKIPLVSVANTDKYIKARLRQVDKLADYPQSEMPDCTPEELWQKDPVFKYFKNPDGKRATKNCATLAEANQVKAAAGGVGVVKTVHGEAKACNYCKGASICEQRQRLVDSKLLTNLLG